MTQSSQTALRNTQTAAASSAQDITKTFVNSLMAASHVASPFDYWLLEKSLPDAAVSAILDLPIGLPATGPAYGKRELNNASRVYFSPENQQAHAICREMSQAFKDVWITSAIKALTGRDVSEGQLRIEYCQDTDGFWLEPHVDISVKLFTMQIYLSDEAQLADAGTTIYDDAPEHNIVATAPYGKAKGLIFIPGQKTWHGFAPRPIHGIRKSIIVNYVTRDWQNTAELS